MSKTVRFAGLVKIAGKPAVYLPFVDPRTDPAFTKLVRAGRVLTVRQTPTGTQKDFGTVGALFEKHVAYLVFPKSLREFEGSRVVGIKYDQLSDAESITPARKPKPARVPVKLAPVPAKPKPEPEKREEKPVVPPMPKVVEFEVLVRVKATKEIRVKVSALSKAEARHKALEQAREQAEFGDAAQSFTILRLKEG